MICSGGLNISININSTKTLIQREKRYTYWSSIYLDEHGEEDVNLRLTFISSIFTRRKIRFVFCFQTRPKSVSKFESFETTLFQLDFISSRSAHISLVDRILWFLIMLFSNLFHNHCKTSDRTRSRSISSIIKEKYFVWPNWIFQSSAVSIRLN